MTRRLNETYDIGETVEVKLRDGSWWPATVMAFDSPGIWVEDSYGRLWFVTNTRHVRNRRDAE